LFFDAHHATRIIITIKESEKREEEQIAIHFLDNGSQSSIRSDAPAGQCFRPRAASAKYELESCTIARNGSRVVLAVKLVVSGSSTAIRISKPTAPHISCVKDAALPLSA
jgi:hypothetical protein